MRRSWPSIDLGDELYRTVCLLSHHRDEVEYTLYVVAAKSISVCSFASLSEPNNTRVALRDWIGPS